ncbi:hypothetical protein MLD38_020923 [Melastoma candidum]|uniref:Uncharacterized protein n=1 Tax=Melastoma candidum TaxID=119954 RepID=A0ACB9QEN8_9MYRT|nr:hypothetical protein MLD38_020923 [Melastoma candidum]
MEIADNVDPYVILTCHSQEQRSSIATGQGSMPRIDLKLPFEEGTLLATTYNVVKDQEYQGQIKECHDRG